MSTQHFVQWGPHEVSTKTEIGKELMRHERPADYNPRNNQFPKMLYKAYKIDGRIECMDVYPKQFAFTTLEQFRMACEAVDSFNQSCQITAESAEQQARMEAEGWRENPVDAKQVQLDIQAEAAREYSRKTYAERNMSPAAKAESAAADEESPDHVLEVPEKRTVKVHHMSKEARAARAATKVA